MTIPLINLLYFVSVYKSLWYDYKSVKLMARSWQYSTYKCYLISKKVCYFISTFWYLQCSLLYVVQCVSISIFVCVCRICTHHAYVVYLQFPAANDQAQAIVILIHNSCSPWALESPRAIDVSFSRVGQHRFSFSNEVHFSFPPPWKRCSRLPPSPLLSAPVCSQTPCL